VIRPFPRKRRAAADVSLLRGGESILSCLDEACGRDVITTAVANWAIERDDIRAMPMLGSWVRGTPRPTSDLDCEELGWKSYGSRHPTISTVGTIARVSTATFGSPVSRNCCSSIRGIFPLAEASHTLPRGDADEHSRPDARCVCNCPAEGSSFRRPPATDGSAFESRSTSE
jgi:hypothetical protein